MFVHTTDCIRHVWCGCFRSISFRDYSNLFFHHFHCFFFSILVLHNNIVWLVFYILCLWKMRQKHSKLTSCIVRFLLNFLLALSFALMLYSPASFACKTKFFRETRIVSMLIYYRIVLTYRTTHISNTDMWQNLLYLQLVIALLISGSLMMKCFQSIVWRAWRRRSHWKRWQYLTSLQVPSTLYL